MTIGRSKYEQACREYGALGDFDGWADLWSVLARRPLWSFHDLDATRPTLRCGGGSELRPTSATYR